LLEIHSDQKNNEQIIPKLSEACYAFNLIVTISNNDTVKSIY